MNIKCERLFSWWLTFDYFSHSGNWAGKLAAMKENRVLSGGEIGKQGAFC